MKIAAIDYGLNCGVAVAFVPFVSEKEIQLRKIVLSTVYDNIPSIRKILNDENPTSVILEASPYRAAGHSLRIFENTYRMIHDLGYFDYAYEKDKADIFTANVLLRIGPGLWKPFVRKQNIDFTPWNPRSKHEQDAMSLLWYAIKIRSEIEVEYV